MSGIGAEATALFDKIGTAIKAFVQREEAQFMAFADKFLPQVENDLEIAAEDLAPIVGSAVLAQATSELSGDEKFGAALGDVIQTVQASGKTIALGVASTAVEQAFQDGQDLVIAKTTTPAA